MNMGLVYLSRLRGLQHLEVTECEKITEKGLWYLTWLTSLQYLNLSWFSQITDEGLGICVD